MSIPFPEKHKITNLFTNPDMVTTSGDVVVWENLIESTSFDQWNAGQGFNVTVEDKVARIEVVGSVGRFFRSPAGNPECEVVTGTFEIWGEGDSVGKTLTMTPGAGNSNFEISIPDSPTVVGATAENVEGLGKTLGILSSGANVNPLEIGDIFYIRNPMINPSGVRTPFFFDSTFSPDPDLTPQPRPGGGSQLVGQRVAGITSFGELFGNPGVAIVQSTQWSKSGDVSARIITIKDFSAEEPLAQLFATLISMSPQSSAPSGSVSFWVRQDSEIGESGTIPELGFGGRIVIASFEDYGGVGELIPNGPGEGIVRVFADTPQEEPDDGTAVTLFAGTNLGDSIWLDLITVTDTEGYDGPPVSGDTDPFVYAGQSVYPEWDGTPHESSSGFVYFEQLSPWKPETAWDDLNVRRFEAGVDRGMLYLDGEGFSWSGLVRVNKSQTSGKMESYYIDGVKFHVDVPRDEYDATIEAFTYPEEFEECIGSYEHEDAYGLFVHGQPSRPFSFAYRTMMGDALDGVGKDYKIHLVYNAYARESNNIMSTMEEVISPSIFAWEITTIPTHLDGVAPTSYYTIDSTKINPIALERLEQVLYGANGIPPRLPDIEDVIEYLSNV